MVYPPTGAQTDCVDHWRCRLLMTPADETQVTAQLAQLLRQVEATGLRWMHIEKLPEFDNARGYTMAQGED
jgi:isocitrate dehydrogenase